MIIIEIREREEVNISDLELECFGICSEHFSWKLRDVIIRREDTETLEKGEEKRERRDLEKRKEKGSRILEREEEKMG